MRNAEVNSFLLRQLQNMITNPGLSGLASQAPRLRRNPTTGKPMEVEEEPSSALKHARAFLNIREFRATRRAEVQAAWGEVVKSAGIDPKTKCVHGHYLHEFYCEVCRLSPVDPDYNPDIYRIEIGKALKQAKKSLTGDEGKKDLKDLQQIVDIEIWKSTKKYGDQMNKSLAYTVANNQAGKYLTERIEEQTVETNDRDGNVFRIPRQISMDDKPLDEEGDEITTKAEIEVINSPAQGTEFPPVQVEQLQILVASWRGEKKLVGEAMLRPGFNVRNVPGVPKSNVARTRQVVLKEFKSFISKGLTK